MAHFHTSPIFTKAFYRNRGKVGLVDIARQKSSAKDRSRKDGTAHSADCQLQVFRRKAFIQVLRITETKMRQTKRISIQIPNLIFHYP